MRPLLPQSAYAVSCATEVAAEAEPAAERSHGEGEGEGERGADDDRVEGAWT
jgi:hypothetical protein